MTAVSPIEPAYAPPPRSTPADATFETLYEQQSSRVFGYCFRWLRSREEAEDAVQTTFLYAMRGLRRGVVPLFDEAWLLAIARNVCLSRTEVARRRAVEVARDPHVLAESVAAPATSDDLAGLSEALTGLTEPQRRAILLREWQGLSYREIANELDLSQAAVETLLFRARRALREQLEGTLTCADAEAALSRQLDGRLSRTEAGFLRAHLRACDECKRLARRQRAQRKGVRALGAIPIPATLGSWFGGGAAATATGAGAGGIGIGVSIAAKGTVAFVAAVAAGAGTYTAVQHATAPKKHHGRTSPPAAPKTVAPAKHAATTAVQQRGAVTVPVRAHGKPGAHPTHPVHPTHPSHPTQPTHPTHPVKPVHPATGSPKPKTNAHPTHPVKPTKPTHPAQPAKTTKSTDSGSQPASPNGQANGQDNGHGANASDQSSHPGK